MQIQLREGAVLRYAEAVPQSAAHDRRCPQNWPEPNSIVAAVGEGAASQDLFDDETERESARQSPHSCGVGECVSCVSVSRQGGSMRLVCPSGRVQDVLRVIHLADFIPTFEDETKALDSFRPQGYVARQ